MSGFSSPGWHPNAPKWAKSEHRLSITNTILTIIVIILTGFTLYFAINDAISDKYWQERQIELLEQISSPVKPDLFERNNECYKYANQLRKDYENESSSVEAIFYSPKLNTCVYHFISFFELIVHNELRDVFTNETYLEETKSVSEFENDLKPFKINVNN